MKNLILMLVIFIANLATSQTQFEQGMGAAMKLWGEGKNDQATALFERIAAAEKNSWLPNYYVAAVNTFGSFAVTDKTKMTAMLDKSQAALDIEMAKNPNNAELLVMQAMIYTALISSDPMTNGMKFSGKVMELYGRAEAIDPKNPRVVFSRAEFAIGGAKWTGANVADLCKDVARSIELFGNFKPETLFSPNWGLERATKAMKNCK